MKKPQVGDWICFTQLGLPCYAKVEYIKEAYGSHRTEYVTTAGTCFYDDVREIRKAKP